MKRPVYITLFLLGLWLLSLVLSACASLEQAPAQATQIAQTVEAGINTAKTILTPVAPITATPEGIIAMPACIPPLDMTTQLTELTLADGRKLVATNGWLSLFKADGSLQTRLQVPTERETVLVELDAPVEVFRCEQTNLVYYNPDSVK